MHATRIPARLTAPFAAFALLLTLTSAHAASSEPGEVDRWSGTDRYATAAAVSEATFPDGTDVVFVATGAAYPDALAGGPAGGVLKGPILLTARESLPAATVAELQRLAPVNIVVLGGPAAVSDAVFAQLDAYATGDVSRWSGSDRFATAAAVSEATFPDGSDVAFIATGADYPDALAGGPAGGVLGGPILLTTRDGLPAATAAELGRLGVERIVVLGGSAAVSDAVVTQLDAYATVEVVRWSGPDRYATAAAVSKASFPEGSLVAFVATGTSFPDALAGGPAGGVLQGPILLASRDSLPATTAAELQRLGAERIVVLGGTAAIAAVVADQLEPAPVRVKVGLAYATGGPGDLSFNDAAVVGLQRAVADFDIAVRDLELDETGENSDELIRTLSRQGFDLVIGVGFEYTDAIAAAATDFPDVRYGLIDNTFEDLAPTSNIAGLVFAEHEGSFLVGAAAALTSQTGHVGFIGGVEFELVQRFEAGFVAGAQAVDPAIEVEVAYISQPPDFSGFTDPAAGKQVALAQFAAGADVVFHAAGLSGLGLFEAAKEWSQTHPKVWAIGVDVDQYLTVPTDLREFILTSMIKRVDVAVYDTIAAVVAGDFEGGTVVFDLAGGALDYATSGGFVDDIVAELEDYRAQIIAGDIVVPREP